MKITKEIKESVKSTIDYAGASSKDSFMVGASVAFRKSEEFYTGIIKNLISLNDYYKNSFEIVSEDMSTLTKIISKYTPQG